MGRIVTILGMGPTAGERRVDIEKYVDGTEVWGLNDGYICYPQLRGKWSRWFELHDYDYLKAFRPRAGGREYDHFREIDALGCEVMVSEPLPLIWRQTVVDWPAVFRSLGGCNYFLGSPTLMLCIALYEHTHGQKIDAIRSWGIDQLDAAHAQQRASWAFWLGYAHHFGIEFQGTCFGFAAEQEQDAGLVGRREKIGAALIGHTHNTQHAGG